MHKQKRYLELVDPRLEGRVPLGELRAAALDFLQAFFFFFFFFFLGEGGGNPPLIKNKKSGVTARASAPPPVKDKNSAGITWTSAQAVPWISCSTLVVGRAE